jgi:hypothetical protein
MKRGLILASGSVLGVALALFIADAGIDSASAQMLGGPGNPFGPPPGQSANPFGPPPGQSGQAGDPFGPPPGLAGPPPEQCTKFPALSVETKKRADAVQTAMKAKADRKEICTLMTNFVAAESVLVKFLKDNKKACGVPEQVVTISSANHEKSIQFRTAACSENAPGPKAPTLSDALRTPVDSSRNVKVGKGGTFDTMTGSPLGR